MIRISYLFRSILLILLFYFSVYSQESVDKVLNSINKISPHRLKGWKTEATILNGAKVDLDDSKWTSINESFSTEDPSRWYRIKVVLPEKISGYNVIGEKIVLNLEVDGKCRIYVNEKLVKDFEKPKESKKVIIIENAKPGESVLIALNIQRIGVISRFMGASLWIGKLSDIQDKIDDLSLSLKIAKMMTSETKEFLKEKTFTINQAQTSPERIKNLRKSLNSACDKIDINALHKGDYNKFTESIEIAKKEMQPISTYAKEHTIYITGNAHIDAAWLWRWPETVDVARYTFLQQLNLIDEYPEYVFSQSSAVYYVWMKEKFPEIFERIKAKVKSGNWELVGGTVIEPDCNLISGESWARQLLYGMEKFKEFFDMMIVLGWNPDSFGYNWNMPQFYKLAGIKAFITQKISWNDMNEFPYHLFWWEAPDGSRILTYFPMSGYVNTLPYDDLIRDLKLSEANTGRKDVLVLYGLGDHGGGPERYMIERVLKFRENPFFPVVKFVKSYDYLKNMTEEYLKTIPVWKDELYLEFHRGTFTTQAATKAGNRKSESILVNAEKISTLSMLNGNKYPLKELNEAWWKTLFNQFHDILPGSSIAPVYDDAKEFYKEVELTASDAIKGSIEQLSKKINTNLIKDGKPFVVYNPLSWERSEICYLDLPKEYSEKNFKIIDDKKQEVQFQTLRETKQIALAAKNIPSLGYKVFYLVESKAPADFKSGIKVTNGEIENNFFKVKIDSKTGNITSIFDKINNKDVLRTPGNLLQIFEDKPLYYDAWEIRYTGKKWELDETKEIKITETGPLVGKIRVSKDFLGDSKSKRIPTVSFPSSFFTQDITLYDGVPRIDINMSVDWWEEHKLLKASFPVNIDNKKATYEIPNAAVERPTTRNNNWEKARYEVPALQWADLSDNNYGVSLLNNSKYGYDIEGNKMRLTLLRAPTSPDPNADRGKHKFTYSIYPHKGDWKEAGTVQKGYELNNPMVVQFIDRAKGDLPLSYSMMSAEGNNIIILAVKKAESGNAIIIRLYEPTGKPYTGNVTLPVIPKSVSEVDLLERTVSVLKFNAKTLGITLKPFETKTIKLEY